MFWGNLLLALKYGRSFLLISVEYGLIPSFSFTPRRAKSDIKKWLFVTREKSVTCRSGSCGCTGKNSCFSQQSLLGILFLLWRHSIILFISPTNSSFEMSFYQIYIFSNYNFEKCDYMFKNLWRQSWHGGINAIHYFVKSLDSEFGWHHGNYHMSIFSPIFILV